MRLGTVLLAVAIVAVASVSAGAQYARDIPSRIPPSKRAFNSSAVNALIDDYLGRMKDTKLGQLFQNCYPNTLDTTVEYFVNGTSGPDAFVITGDIHATWLRDSTNQLLPYVALAKADRHLRDLICGVVNRQARDILVDPYANAFNKDNDGGHQDDDRKPRMTPHVFEGKYELDSLAAHLKLSYNYWLNTNDVTCFDTPAGTWKKAARLIVDTIKIQTVGTKDEGSNPPYLFARLTTVATDTLVLQKRGPVGRTCGLSKSPFRPSDDATTLPFHIPSNAMAVVELQHLSILANISGSPTYDAQLSADAAELATSINNALLKYGIARDMNVWAYEVDGYGGRVIMDDANIPSLLSLPYLGYLDRRDAIYQSTRAVLWSDNNPYWFKGTAGEGIGGPHVGMDYIWPMSLIMRALTSTSDDEIMSCLNTLKASALSTGFMHESFHKNNVDNYTRSWFAWANALFGELIITIGNERPHLIFK